MKVELLKEIMTKIHSHDSLYGLTPQEKKSLIFQISYLSDKTVKMLEKILPFLNSHGLYLIVMNGTSTHNELYFQELLQALDVCKNYNTIKYLILITKFLSNEKLVDIFKILSIDKNEYAAEAIYDLISSSKNIDNNVIIEIAKVYASIKQPFNMDSFKLLNNMVINDDYEDKNTMLQELEILAKSKNKDTLEFAERALYTKERFMTDQKSIKYHQSMAQIISQANNPCYIYNEIHSIHKPYELRLKNAKLLQKVSDSKTADIVLKLLEENELKDAYGDDLYYKIMLYVSKSNCPNSLIKFIEFFANDTTIKKDVLNCIEKVYKLSEDDAETAYDIFHEQEIGLFNYALKKENITYIDLIYTLYDEGLSSDSIYRWINRINKVRNKENTEVINDIVSQHATKKNTPDEEMLYINYAHSVANSSSKYVDFNDYFIENEEDALYALEKLKKEHPEIDLNASCCYVRKKKKCEK